VLKSSVSVAEVWDDAEAEDLQFDLPSGELLEEGPVRAVVLSFFIFSSLFSPLSLFGLRLVSCIKCLFSLPGPRDNFIPM